MNDLKNRVAALEDELIEVRRDLHRHPEPGFEEHYTAGKVSSYLRDAGYEVTEGVGGTGVVALLRGGKEGKTFAIRACLDALEIPETTGVEYASENEGYMHACGHDGNMTVALGAAKVLAGMKDEISGNIKMIFQPSEENTGGAAEIVSAGHMEDPKIDAIITPHVWHDVPLGKIGMKEGPVMCSSDLFKIEVHGKAGHVSFPDLAVDPLITAAELILSLEKITKSEIDPLVTALVSIGKVEYGTAANIISQTVTMWGTVRTYDAAARDYIEKRIHEITEGICLAGRCTFDIEYDRVMPPLINDKDFVRQASAAVDAQMGEGTVYKDYPSRMGCEEFSVYEDYAPGIFMLIGNHREGDPVTELHNRNFLFEESNIAAGVEALCAIALDYLSGREK